MSGLIGEIIAAVERGQLALAQAGIVVAAEQLDQATDLELEVLRRLERHLGALRAACAVGRRLGGA